MGRAQELGVYAWKENQRVVDLANTLFGLFLQSSRFARRLERIAQDRRNGDYATYHSYGHAGAFLISFPFPVSVAALGQKERIERGADRHITAAPSKHTIFFLSFSEFLGSVAANYTHKLVHHDLRSARSTCI